MVGGADELGRGEVTRSDEVIDVVVLLVEDAGCVHPPVDVSTSVGPRQSHVSTDGDGDWSSGSVDLVGELDSGRRSTDDQYAAIIEIVRRSVGHRRERLHRCRDSCRYRGDVGNVARATGHYDARAGPCSVVRGDLVAVVVGSESGDRRVREHRGVNGRRVRSGATKSAQTLGDDQLHARCLFELGTALVHAVRGHDDEGAVLLPTPPNSPSTTATRTSPPAPDANSAASTRSSVDAQPQPSTSNAESSTPTVIPTYSPDSTQSTHSTSTTGASDTYVAIIAATHETEHHIALRAGDHDRAQL